MAIETEKKFIVSSDQREQVLENLKELGAKYIREDFEENTPVALDDERREALTSLASQLLELREMLKTKKTDTASVTQRKY